MSISRARLSVYVCALLFGVALLSSCRRPGPTSVAPSGSTQESVTPPGPPLFADMTRSSGLDFTYRNGEEADHFTILESLGGGVGLLDYDQDGLLDVFVTGGGEFTGADRKAIRGLPSRLFRNLGGWKFRDVTRDVGLPDDGAFYSHGVAVADFDNDGWPDLLVTGYGRLALHRNNQGKFTEVTADAGIDDPGRMHWSTSAGWGDLNGDGWPDLFVAHYVNWSFNNHPPCELPDGKVDVCSPRRFESLPGALYVSKAGKSFVRQDRAGIKAGPGLGVLIADLDDDGRPDVYVANDTTENFLYRNLGEGRFEEVGTIFGVAYDERGRPTGSMGVDAADCDGSGRQSLFVTNFESEDHTLYQNLGPGRFLCISRAAGIAALGREYVGFGTGFLDFDHDGQLDLFVTNGHVLRRPPSGKRRQQAVLLRNLRKASDSPGQVRFADVSGSGGDYFRAPHSGRGAALGDLDNDGKVDLVISHANEPVALLRNVAPAENQWLGVALEGKGSRDAVGTKVTLTQGSNRQVRTIRGGGSYLSSNDCRVLFRVGPGPCRLVVRWPSGREQTWEDAALKRDRYLRLVEGDDQPQPWPGKT